MPRKPILTTALLVVALLVLGALWSAADATPAQKLRVTCHGVRATATDATVKAASPGVAAMEVDVTGRATVFLDVPHASRFVSGAIVRGDVVLARRQVQCP